MKKMGIAGLALVLVGALVFGAGYIGARGDLSVVNGNMGPFRVQLADGHVHSGFFYTDSGSRGDSSQSGIGGGRNKPVTTPPPVPTPMPTPTPKPAGEDDGDADCRSFPGEEVRKMELNINYADVVLLTSFDTNVYVYSGNLNDFRFTSDKNGVMSIESRNMKTVWGINLGTSRPTLTVAVPAALDSLEVDVSCGSIELEEVALGKLRLDSSMGDVYVSGVECRSAEMSSDCGSVQALSVISSEKLEADSDMGDVTVEKCEVGGKLTAESSCGNVNVIDCTAADAEISSDMGNVKASGLDCARSVKLDCDCGAISFYGLSAKTIEIDNSMGSIEGTLPGSISDYSIESGTDLGSNNLPSKLEMGDIRLKVTDSCGSIDVSFSQDN